MNLFLIYFILIFLVYSIQSATISNGLHFYASIGDEDALRLLLNNGANIEAEDEYGKTALHVSAGSGHLEIIKLLLDRGAEIEAVDDYDITALHLSVQNRHIKISRLLL